MHNIKITHTPWDEFSEQILSKTCLRGARTTRTAALERSRRHLSIDACLAWRLLALTPPVVENTSLENRPRGGGTLRVIWYTLVRQPQETARTQTPAKAELIVS